MLREFLFCVLEKNLIKHFTSSNTFPFLTRSTMSGLILPTSMQKHYLLLENGGLITPTITAEAVSYRVIGSFVPLRGRNVSSFQDSYLLFFFVRTFHHFYLTFYPSIHNLPTAYYSMFQNPYEVTLAMLISNSWKRI